MLAGQIAYGDPFARLGPGYGMIYKNIQQSEQVTILNLSPKQDFQGLMIYWIEKFVDI